MGIPMLKIRWSQNRLIFNMGIPILVRQHLYIERAPCWSWLPKLSQNEWEMNLDILKLGVRVTGLSVDIFVEGLRPPPFEFPRAPSKIWRVPPLKYITNSPILGGPSGPQAKFYKGPIGFSGVRGLYLRSWGKLSHSRSWHITCKDM